MVMVVQEDRLRFNYKDNIKKLRNDSLADVFCGIAGDQDMLSSFKWIKA